MSAHYLYLKNEMKYERLLNCSCPAKLILQSSKKDLTGL